jgi:energy-coupling factor transport system permease protein
MIGISGVQPRPWLVRLDPRVKLAWLVAVSLGSVMLDRPAALAVLCVMAALPLLGLSLRGRNWLVLVVLLLSVAWGTLLSQAIFYAYVPRTPLLEIVPAMTIGSYEFPGVIVYREGAIYGLSQSMRFLAVTLAGLTTYLSTSPERLLAVLGRLRVPTSISFLTVTSLRMLPQVLDDFRLLRQARAMRGYRASTIGWHRGVWDEMKLVGPLMAVAVRRASNLAMAVSTRGFDPCATRTYYPAMRLRPLEVVGIAVVAATVATLVVVKTLYWLYVAEIYYHPDLREIYDLVRRWL